MENSNRTTASSLLSSEREAIQAEMRKRFHLPDGNPDNTIFLQEVTQYDDCYSTGQRYLVYLDYEWCVDFREYNWPCRGQAKVYNQVKLLEYLSDGHFSDDERKSFRRYLAQALVAAYDNQWGVSETLLDTAKKFYYNCLAQKTIDKHFNWHVIFLILAWFFMLLTQGIPCIKTFLYSLLERKYWSIAFWAINGMYLSFCHRGGQRGNYFQCSLKYAVRHFLFAALCGIVACLFFSCETVCPEFLAVLIESRYGIPVLGVVVGFCESMVPSWIERFATVINNAMKQVIQAWNNQDSQPPITSADGNTDKKTSVQRGGTGGVANPEEKAGSKDSCHHFSQHTTSTNSESSRVVDVTLPSKEDSEK